MSFRHNCKHSGCYIETQTPDWAFLEGSFTREEAKPTDIDGFIEENSKFLVLEWKGTTAELTRGQCCAYVALTEKTDDFVLVLYGDAEKTQVEFVRTIWRGRLSDKDAANNLAIQSMCRRWAAWAQSQPKRSTYALNMVALGKLAAEQGQAA